MEKPGLYVHIPFCLKKCGYCDFYSITQTSLVPDYVEAVKREMGLYRDEFQAFDTVYFGGGTPSLLRPEQIADLLDAIGRTFAILPGVEVTCEVNPADLNREGLKRLHDLGVNRLNIGVQSFDDEELVMLGRRHNRMQAVAAFEDACSAGFENIGLDLIYCLPGQSLSMWEENLRQAIDLRPAHLSCYELELKTHTPLGQRLARGEIAQPGEDTQREFFLRTSEILEAAGFIHYEVSNFALGPDMASRHNRKYWDHTPYLGLGPSAHSFMENRRWWNHSSLPDYLRDISAGHRPMAGQESLSEAELFSEALMLGLRTSAGIDLEEIKSRFGRDLLQEKAQILEGYRRSGLIIIESGCIRPTRAGLAVADGLARL
ncbi:MAG: radical SAM family heme chaperone HemW [Syntrophaceae bacterium]